RSLDTFNSCDCITNTHVPLRCLKCLPWRGASAWVRYPAMRLDLEGLDAKGVELAFDTDASHPRRVSLGRTQKLSGMLTKTEGSLLLTDVQAEAIVVSLLELALSSFSVQLGAEGALRGLMGGYRREE